MTTLTIKNLPGELYERLKQRAAEHRRSINSEVIICLERALSNSRIDAAAFLSRARELRKHTSGQRLTDKRLSGAKNEGRP
jgi:plasmid stability protein